MAAITNSTTKEIKYDRVTKDYACYLDGQLIGYAPTYSAGESLCNDTYYEQLAHATSAAPVEEPAAVVVAEPDVMTADVALHILGEINQAEAIRLAETRKTHASADVRANIIREWQSVIDRKRTHLNVYGYRTQLSEMTGAYVPSGNGHGWQYVSGQRVAEQPAVRVERLYYDETHPLGDMSLEPRGPLAYVGYIVGAGDDTVEVSFNVAGDFPPEVSLFGRDAVPLDQVERAIANLQLLLADPRVQAARQPMKRAA
jgi:hypothetical protein